MRQTPDINEIPARIRFFLYVFYKFIFTNLYKSPETMEPQSLDRLCEISLKDFQEDYSKKCNIFENTPCILAVLSLTNLKESNLQRLWSLRALIVSAK